jgi:hypothetical protein
MAIFRQSLQKGCPNSPLLAFKSRILAHKTEGNREQTAESDQCQEQPQGNPVGSRRILAVEESRPDYILARTGGHNSRGAESENACNGPLAPNDLRSAFLGLFRRMLRVVLNPRKVPPNEKTTEEEWVVVGGQGCHPRP